MINLLPQARQKKIQLEEMAKIAAILGMVVIAALLVFALMLLLVKNFYAVQSESVAIALAEKEREMEIYGVKKIEDRIGENNKLVSRVSDFSARQIKITDIFSQTAAALPPGVYLFEFGYDSSRVNLEGFAPDRAALVVLKNNLEKRADFSKVVFPSETWMKAMNINFSVNFSYAKH
jgi:Tfp pilus assembly protein PilN